MVELSVVVRAAKPTETKAREGQTCQVCRKNRGILFMVEAVVRGAVSARIAIGPTLYVSREPDVRLPGHACCSLECANAKAAELTVVTA